MQRTFIVTLVVCVVFGFAIADFRDDALKLHNRFRAKHHAPRLSLCDKLNSVAQNYANKMARTNNFGHSGSEYGENIGASAGKAFTDSQAAIDAINGWYNESSQYDYNNGDGSDDTGHFTQLVWKSSKHLGIGVAKSKRGMYYVVANYDPPGNDGNYRANVLRP